MKKDLRQRFGFLLNDVARLYGRRFDQLARERIGLSRAQCRLLGALAMQNGPMSQSALADHMDLTTMAVTGLCDRMVAGGWIRRAPSPSDRRANEIHLEPKAVAALEAALAVSDSIQEQVFAGFSAAERTQLLTLMRRLHGNVLALPGEDGAGE